MSVTSCPIVIVCSEGTKSSLEIINNIRKISADENTVDLGNSFTGHKYRNVTKYYENDIVFVSQNQQPLSLLPADLLDRIEGCIVYFDADNRDFLTSLKSYADFMQENNVEFGILLCSELFDNTADGITYKEAKVYSNILDVIELDRTRDSPDDDDDEEDEYINHHDPVGYDELLQALRAVIWSNVDLKRKANGNILKKTAAEETCAEGEGATASGSSEIKPTPAPEKKDGGGEKGQPNVEADLEAFEQLLTEVMMFKNTTANWSRNERLAYAEKFAYAFDDLLGGAEKRSDSEDESSP